MDIHALHATVTGTTLPPSANGEEQRVRRAERAAAAQAEAPIADEQGALQPFRTTMRRDATTGANVVEFRDPETDEMLYQLPPKQILDLLKLLEALRAEQ